MTKTLINRDTFVASGEAITKTFDSGYSFTYTPGTVEVTLRGQTKRVEAKLFGEDDICAYDLVGRYQSATKLWPAVISSRIWNDKLVEDVRFGRDDRNPKFRKENCIWFAR
jgi:hypothetical protein